MAMKDELQFKHAPFFWTEEGFNFKGPKKKKIYSAWTLKTIVPDKTKIFNMIETTRKCTGI